MLVDETDGRFRYFIIDTGFWVFGKKVLFPVFRIDYDDKHVYAERLTKEQVQDLPEFSEDLAINNDYEERVRGVYRPLVATSTWVRFITLIPDYDQEPYLITTIKISDCMKNGSEKKEPYGADIL